MCIFTGPVDALLGVSATSIFARALDGGRQILVYSMSVTARDAVAMVLPVPVPPGSADDALRFIDLEAYPDLFDDLDRSFPVLPMLSGSPAAQLVATDSALEVHDVGAFEASFVPSRDDFGRLDRRFRLADDVLAALPQYSDWGFAVFQLRDVAEARGWLDRLLGRAPRPASKTIHPMAFELPVREPDRLFFPTVHVHDGTVHPEALFDHSLYAQPGSGHTIEDEGWEVSTGPLGRFVDVGRAAGVIDGDLPAFRTRRNGMLPNADTYASTGRGEPPLPA